MGVTIVGRGTAQTTDVRTGVKFTSDSGVDQTGTLAQVAGGNTVTPTTTAQTAIAAQTIAEAAISVAGDANLTGGNIKPGVSIFGVASTMPSQNAVNITPSTVSQTAVAAGTYAAGAATVSGDANLISANIVYGTSIFGVAGATKTYASGTFSPGSSTPTITVSGLSFQPSRVIVTGTQWEFNGFTGITAAFDSGISATDIPWGTSSAAPCTLTVASGGFTLQLTGTSSNFLTGESYYWIALQ